MLQAVKGQGKGTHLPSSLLYPLARNPKYLFSWPPTSPEAVNQIARLEPSSRLEQQTSGLLLGEKTSTGDQGTELRINLFVPHICLVPFPLG